MTTDAGTTGTEGTQGTSINDTSPVVAPAQEVSLETAAGVVTVTVAPKPGHIFARTLRESAHYPEHGPRAGDIHYRIFNHARHHMIDVIGIGCWIGGATKAQILAGLPLGHPCHGCSGLEGHHDIAEFSALEEMDWRKVAADFPREGIDSDEKFKEVAESEGGLLILCSVHHRSPFRGIHSITGPVWKLQRYERDGWDFIALPPVA